jgi:hypothetical protein
MLDAKDLMIGNLITVNGIVITVNATVLYEGGFSDGYYKPITLTKEWLIKFDINDRQFFGGVLHKISAGYNLIFQGHLILYFKYVHQIQNFYNLRGLELTIKKP